MKKVVAALMVAGLLLAGGVALAQEPDPELTPDEVLRAIRVNIVEMEKLYELYVAGKVYMDGIEVKIDAAAKAQMVEKYQGYKAECVDLWGQLP